MSYDLLYSRKQPPELLFKKGVLAEDCDFIKKEALAGVFLWILWNFNNTFFTERLRTTASAFNL